MNAGQFSETRHPWNEIKRKSCFYGWWIMLEEWKLWNVYFESLTTWINDVKIISQNVLEIND